MQQFQFDNAMFETHFKPWLLRKLERHANSVIDELVCQFRDKLRQISLEAKADITVSVGEAVPEGVKTISITFSPDLDSDY